MKKKLILTGLIFSSLLITNPALAWDDCPYGLENDPYPGVCSRYIDTDGDGICDHSQPAPEDRVAVLEETSSTENETDTQTAIIEISEEDEDEYPIHISGKNLRALTIDQLAELWGNIPSTCLINHLSLETGDSSLTGSTSIQYLHDTYDLEPSTIKAIAQAVYDEKYHSDTASTETPASSALTDTVSATSQAATELPAIEPKITDKYHFTTLALAAAVLFLIGKVLVFSKKIKAIAEKRFWNVLLLISFMGSGITGLVLSMRRDYGIFISLPANFLWLHAVTSIVMAFISIYHIIWHWKYYWCLIFKPKKKASCDQ